MLTECYVLIQLLTVATVVWHHSCVNQVEIEAVFLEMFLNGRFSTLFYCIKTWKYDDFCAIYYLNWVQRGIFGLCDGFPSLISSMVSVTMFLSCHNYRSINGNNKQCSKVFSDLSDLAGFVEHTVYLKFRCCVQQHDTTIHESIWTPSIGVRKLRVQEWGYRQ